MAKRVSFSWRLATTMALIGGGALAAPAQSSAEGGFALDSAGNAYLTGNYTVGSGETSRKDFSTVKYDSAGNQLWVNRYNGPGSYSRAAGIGVDQQGNAYVVASTPGKKYAKNPSDYDITVFKYDSAGKQSWVQRYNSPKGWDSPSGIVVDSSGYVYVAGDITVKEKGKKPGRYDSAVLKYDSAGKRLWAKRYNGPYKGSSRPSTIALDSAGNPYLTGDAQSGAETYDVLTAKYDSKGRSIWRRSYAPGGYWSQGAGVAADSAGNAYVVGEGVDNKGTSVYPLIKYQQDTNKKQDGKQAWVVDNGGPPAGVAADQSGNVYVLQGSSQFTTVKYDSSGKVIWTQVYSEPQGSATPEALAVAADGTVYVAGSATSESGSGTDLAAVGYGKKGERIWANRYNFGPGSYIRPITMAIDSAGNSYVLSNFEAEAMNPQSSYLTVKVDSAGNEVWLRIYTPPKE